MRGRSHENGTAIRALITTVRRRWRLRRVLRGLAWTLGLTLAVAASVFFDDVFAGVSA